MSPVKFAEVLQIKLRHAGWHQFRLHLHVRDELVDTHAPASPSRGRVPADPAERAKQFGQEGAEEDRAADRLVPAEGIGDQEQEACRRNDREHEQDSSDGPCGLVCLHRLVLSVSSPLYIGWWPLVAPAITENSPARASSILRYSLR